MAVFNVEGQFYATQDECTHADGPLTEGDLVGCTIICPWHASIFDVGDGSVKDGPAMDPLKVYKVAVDGEIGRVTG